MSMSDPTSDMLTRLRNANSNRCKFADVYLSKFGKLILEVLKKEGYIKSFDEVINENKMKMMRVHLKYENNQRVLTQIQRVSKPGRRVYASIATLPKVKNGLGVAILSTSKGVLSDNEARHFNVGGEVICYIS